MGWKDRVDFVDLRGKTITKINQSDSQVIFETKEGISYIMLHHQDCCENVYVEDIAGDLSDLIGTPVLMAEEVTSDENPPDYNNEYSQDSFTWTFYKLATIKGYVTIRWYGESNGYYSESVDFEIYK